MRTPSTEEVLRPRSAASAEPVEPGWEDRWREFHRPVRVGRVVDRPALGGCRRRGERGRRSTPAGRSGPEHTRRRARRIELLAGVARGERPRRRLRLGRRRGRGGRLGFAPVTPSTSTRSRSRRRRRTPHANGVSVDVRRADVLVDELPPADVVVANIELGAVERLLRAVDGAARDRLRLPRAERLEAPGWRRSRARAARRLGGGRSSAPEPHLS